MRFNSFRENPRKAVTHEGSLAYTPPTPEQHLYSLTACTFLNDSFYTPANEITQAILDQIEKCDPLFVSKLAVYLRNDMYLRTAPILLITKLALMGKLKAGIVPRVIIRADEIKELLACWKGLSGNPDLKKMPNQLKKGIALAFNNFNSFQFRKYNKQGKETITFKDAMRLVHPKPKSEEHAAAFRAIKEDNLPAIDTWETVLSSGKDKKEAWESLIKENKIPYMAALRNAKNIIKAQVDLGIFNEYLDLLSDKEKVLRSKQFPFRFWSALDQIHDLGDIRVRPTIDAIAKAITYSVDNIPGIENLKDKSVLIACDVSGSMTFHTLSQFSSVRLIDVGVILGRLLASQLRYVVTGVFGDEWAPCHFGNHPLDQTQMPAVGYATYTHKVLEWAIQNRKQFDRLIFFSDLQIANDYSNTISSAGYRGPSDTKSLFQQAWRQYKKDYPDAQMILFNLQGYGTTPIDLIDKDVYMVSGFSSNIFRAISDWKNIKEIILNA